MTDTAAGCPHPPEALYRDRGRYGCRACGQWSTMATVEGRPILEVGELNAYRRAHPETMLGTAPAVCETCGVEYAVTTSFTCIDLSVSSEPPLRWESLISRDGDEEMAPVRYATAEDAQRGHDALQAAARGHVLCVLRDGGMEEAAAAAG